MTPKPTSGRDFSISLLPPGINLPREQVSAVLCRALRLGPLIGDAEKLIPSSERPRCQIAIELAETLEEKLASLVRKDADLCLRGLELHLRHYNRQKRDVVFRGKKDEGALIQYILFLSALGVPDTQFQWTVRRLPGQTAELPTWVDCLIIGWFPERIRQIAPRTSTKAASDDQWLGLQVVDSKSRGLAAVMATTFVLAYASLMSDSCQPIGL